MKKIVIDYPTYRLEIPVIEVAKDRANCYAEIDSKEYQDEIKYLLNDEDEAVDWLLNSTDPSDFKDVAKVVLKEIEVDWDYWGDSLDIDVTVEEQ